MKSIRVGAFLLAFVCPAPAGAQTMLNLPDNREGWPWGFCVHQLHAQHEAEAASAIDELGAPWVRIDADWNGIETSDGVFEWSIMDKMVDTARAHGHLVFATLAYTPQWATDGAVRTGVPRSPDLYRHFVKATVERYRDRVKHWGMWNEPEQRTSGRGRSSSSWTTS
ncbi:MAG: endo-1,4-beta-xylanase [Deltaproteobacteria bacterium]|nr:endo-1,4-beta-xylanase [Deltaproteobacteria bacterium]